MLYSETITSNMWWLATGICARRPQTRLVKTQLYTPETDGIIEMDPEDEMWKTKWNEDQIVWDNGHILWINKNAPERKGKPHI